MLRVIPITKPGTTGFTFAIARTDAEETAAREIAANRGLLAGIVMPIKRQPGDFDFWKFQDSIKQR